MNVQNVGGRNAFSERSERVYYVVKHCEHDPLALYSEVSNGDVDMRALFSDRVGLRTVALPARGVVITNFPERIARNN